MGIFHSKKIMARKVAVLGAAGGIGQPLSMLIKSLPEVKELSVYDVVPVISGVAADLSHMDTDCKVTGYCDPLGSNSTEQLDAALKGCELVIIPAGVPRKPGMTRDDLFKINAGIVKNLCEAVARNCPNAWVNIISNPVNSTVPIAKAVFEKAGTYDKKKLFGVTTLDVLRANTFVGEKKGVEATKVSVPVVGGHAGVTILPLLSQTTPSYTFTDDELKALTTRIQNGGTEVVEAKQGAGSATLSMAFAAYKFAIICLKAMSGDKQVACTYVESSVVEGLEFFSSKVMLGPTGAEEVMGLGDITDFEKSGLEALKSELAGSIQKGLEFVNGAA